MKKFLKFLGIGVFILIAAGMDANELFERYLKKNKINIDRQNNGY